jgi:hypothetical protein
LVTTRDWREWHRHYDDPDSPLANRLTAVRTYLRQALAEAPDGEDGVVRLTSICAGEGRDVLPVLAEGNARPVSATLIEFDPALAQRARDTAARLGLSRVEVRIADAGATDTYLTMPRAHVLMVCGVFGNISSADTRRTIGTLPALVAPGGFVIWTRGTRQTNPDPSQEIRTRLSARGFAEMSFLTTADGLFRVGMHRLAVGADTSGALAAGTRMFAFA